MFFSRVFTLSIVLILAGAAGLVCLLRALADPPGASVPVAALWIGAATGFAVAGASFAALLRLDRSWEGEFRARFDERPEETLARWTVSPECRDAFLECERRSNRPSARLVAGILGPASAVIVLAAGGRSAGFPAIVGWSLVAGGAVAALVLVIGALASRSRRERGALRPAAAEPVDVRLREDGLRVGRDVISWSHFGATLHDARLEPAETPDASWSVATFVVQTAGGRHPVRRTHRVPVPREAKDRVTGAVRTLGGAPRSGDEGTSDSANPTR